MTEHQRNRRVTLKHFREMRRVCGSRWVKMSIQAKRSVILNCVDSGKPLACRERDVEGYLSILAEAERKFT
jgi:hypothetical protein